MDLLKTNALQKIFIPAGNLHLTNKNLILWTTLGSCISVIFHHKPTKLTGMFHAQLPQRNESNDKCFENCTIPCYLKDRELADTDYMYVSCSIKFMNNFFIKKNIIKSKIDVYMLGGASILNNERKQLTVGDRNILVAEQHLSDYPIAGKHVGGTNGRSVFFNTSTGVLEIKTVPNSNLG